MPGPLDGVRVLEFSVIYAGPFGGLHLSDFGAEVIKVEAPGGEPFRHQGAVVPGESKAFHWLNRGKQSLVLDLSDPRGQEVIHRLIVDTDVVLINYRPGVPERLGIDYETLSAIKPDLVYADITAFGTEGPLADRAGSDIVAQAYSGLIALDGKTDEHGSPESVAFAAGDCTTGAASVMGILAALFHRERTGEGQIIRAQLLRSVMSFTGISSMREPASDFAGSDRTRDATNQARDAGGSYDDIIEARRELGKELRAAFGIYYAGYRVKDGGMVLGALTPANRDAFRKVLGIEDDPSAAPDYDARDPENIKVGLALKERVRKQMLTRTVAEWIDVFEAAGAPVAPVNFPEDLADDEQAGVMMVELEHELVGYQKQVGPIVQMSATPTAIAGPSSPLGKHTDELMRSAGYSPDQIAELRAAEVAF